MAKKKVHKSKGLSARERIIDAAASCIATHGIEKTSITAIADKAKLTRGLISFYFPRKAEIFIQVIEKIAELFYSEFRTPEASLTNKEKIIHTLRENLNFFFGHPTYFRCFMLLYYYATTDRIYRTLNTKLMSAAPERISGFLLDLLPNLSKEKVEIQSQSIHSTLLGSLQKFYSLDHNFVASEYTDQVLSSINDQLDGLIKIYGSRPN